MKKAVENLVEGDRVDLASCPYLHAHPSAPFEYAVVDGTQRETSDYIVVMYEGIDLVGYKTGTELEVRDET